MLTIQEILRTKSDMLDHTRVKLVRHKDNRAEYRDIIKDQEKFLTYQSDQPKEVFKGCDYIVSFIGQERNRSLLFGVFKVNGIVFQNDTYCYDLQRVNIFEDLVDRVVIDWGNNALAWHQWYHRQQKEVIEILPKGYMGDFPGLLEFVLDFDDLKRLVTNPEANYEWKNHLSAVNGIYMILDDKTGKQYIGSANGKEGIWQRWSTYAQNITGGNKELKNLLEADPKCYQHFKYSVLQTLPSNITQREIVAIENLYKEKLGARTHGLNAN